MSNAKVLSHFQQWVDAIPDQELKKENKDDFVFFVTLMNYFGVWEVWVSSEVRGSMTTDENLCRSCQTDNGFSSRDDALIYIGQLRQQYSRFEIQLKEDGSTRKLKRLCSLT